jgi:hypothetical protein
VTRKKKPDTGQTTPSDTASEAAATSQDAPDTPDRQGDAPATGPFAHDPAAVVAPPNPAKLSAPADSAAARTAPPTTAPETAPDTADESATPDSAAETDAPETDARAAEEPAPQAPEPATRANEDRATPAPKGSAPDTPGETVTIRQGGFWSMLFGGALAASIGVVASPYILSSEMLEGRVPAFLAPTQQGEDEVATRIAAQGDRLNEIETRLDDLSGDIRTAMDRPDPPPDLGDEVAGLTDSLSGVDDRIAGIEGQIADLEEQIGDTEGRISELGNRLTAVEDRPIPTSDGSEVSSSEIESLRRRLEEQRADMEAQRSDIESLTSEIGSLGSEIETQAATIADQREALTTQAENVAAMRDAAEAEEQAARDSARAALRRAALSRVQTALDTGQPFEDALTDLRETDVELPEALTDLAQTGVPTRSDLAESFPDAARAALSRIRNAQDGLGAVEIGDFFRNQLGMRSLVPREGDDPDAILSRAEAAIREGRLDAALSEIENLPEDARAALDDWVARATQRQQALSGADALSDRLN